MRWAACLVVFFCALCCAEPVAAAGRVECNSIRSAVLGGLGPAFAFAELARRFPEVKAARLRRVLADLKRENRVTRTGAGLAARWVPESR